MTTINASILRIIDQNTSDNDEKNMVISILQHNECEKLHELIAAIDNTNSLRQFCNDYDGDLDDELIPRMIHAFFRDIIDADYVLGKT